MTDFHNNATDGREISHVPDVPHGQYFARFWATAVVAHDEELHVIATQSVGITNMYCL